MKTKNGRLTWVSVLVTILAFITVLARPAISATPTPDVRDHRSPTPIVSDHRTPTRANEIIPRRSPDSSQTSDNTPQPPVTQQPVLPSFWFTLPGILTAMAAFIGAIAALVAAFSDKR